MKDIDDISMKKVEDLISRIDKLTKEMKDKAEENRRRARELDRKRIGISE